LADNLAFVKQIATGLARQFGENCEIVVHDLMTKDIDNSIVMIENGHITNRQVGDGPSHIVLEALNGDPQKLEDRLGYLTKTKDGRILKSSTMYIRDENGKPISIFAINFDITGFAMVDKSIKSLITSDEVSEKEPESITNNVNDLLDNLLEESVRRAGKPVPLMTKEDKIAAIQFLKESGAFLVTKSGDKVSAYFGISKFTLYSYIDNK
jgi:predicted transcriptional regulator YheO